jgi:imidazoleglycerol-phosphate dehydratase
MARQGEVVRITGETDITLKLELDGQGSYEIATGVPFLDHMLALWTKHGLFDLILDAKGDVEVDDHHSVEDIGIALGLAFKKAVGEKKGIKRYGTAYVPMDEALAMVSLDLSGRDFLVFEVNIPAPKVGTFDTELLEEFMRAFASNAGITLHIELIRGKNTHHIIEAIFKALGRALSEAVLLDERIKGVLSTKGVL